MLVRGGIALIGLHVVDDSFVQPQSGTAAADHLAGGLIPVVLLALAGWRYPHLRPGIRATVALAVGFFGVVTGVEAGYYTLQVGPSGDDYTGLVALLAGVGVFGTAVVTLWRTRRGDESRPRRYFRRVLWSVTVFVVLVEVGSAVALTYVATHVARADVPTAELGRAHEEVTLTTGDGLELAGWYVPSRNGAAVISFPGRHRQAQARMLAGHGYGVLLFDRRGEGDSDGDGNLFGWGGERDIFAAIEFLQNRPDVDPGRIGGIGYSVGGELMLQAAAEHPDLAAVVSDAAGTRTFSEDVHEVTGPARWLGYPFLLTKTAGTATFSNTMPPPSLMSLVSRIAPKPVLFIWSPKTGGEDMNPTYYRLAEEPKDVWEIPEADHVGGITARPEEYERRVVGFFDRALLGHARKNGS